MTNANQKADNGGKRTYAINLQAKVQSSTSCSFCWFVHATYPSLAAMAERDTSTYRAHLEKAHGLQGEIQP